MLLEVLTDLPDEIENDRLRVMEESVRRDAFALFSSFGNSVFEILVSYMKSAGTNRALQIKVLKCFHSWVRFVEVNGADLAGNPLFLGSLDAIKVPELFDVSVDVLCQIIRKTEDVNQFSQVITTLIPRALALMPLYGEWSEWSDWSE